MKRFTLLFIIIFLLVSCGPKHSNIIKNNYSPDKKQLQKTVKYLASDELKGREFGSEGIEKAAQYLEKELQKSALKPYFKTYRDSFEYKGKIGYNIVAFKEGSDKDLKDEIIILGAHYDHIGIIAPKNGDSIANGANDDASGTAAVLELAKTFAHKNTKRSILFTFFSAEEKGLVGSQHSAQKLKAENTRPYFMLNYEMIGTPLHNKDYKAYLTGFKTSNLAEELNHNSKDNILGFWPDEDKYQVFRRSDNYAFYRILSIPAHTISSFDFINFNQYHQVGDDIDLIDFDFMYTLINATVPGIEALANSPNNTVSLKFN